MTTNDKRPPRTTKTAKTAKTPTVAAETSGTVRRTGGAYSPSTVNAPAAAGTSGAPHAPSPSLKASGAANASRPAKSKNDAAPPAGTQTSESPAIKAISVSVTPRYREDRHASIAKAAYFRSESRGFAPGREVEDWLAAEEEVDQRLLGEGRAS
jgi:hypothetical protein